jgi:hypothetical protein
MASPRSQRASKQKNDDSQEEDGVLDKPTAEEAMNAPIKRKAPVKKSKKTTKPEELLDNENKKGEKVAKATSKKKQKYSKREAQLRKCLQQPILLFFRVTPVTFDQKIVHKL